MSSSNQSSETLKLAKGKFLKVEKKDGGNVYTYGKHSDGLRNTINDMHIKNLLHDVTLVTDHTEVTEEIRAHKVVLAASSRFFYTKFSKNCGKSEERIVLDGVHRFALPKIVEFIYTGKIFITADNVDGLLRAAHRLLVTDVFKACVHFMQTHLTVENCFNFAALAKEHDCVDFKSQTDTYIAEHFCEIVRTQSYLDLSNESLTEILKSDKLKVSNQIEVFDAVVSWVKHMIETRQQYLASLLEYVRFPLMSLEDLIEKLEQEPLFTNNTLCFKYIREVMGYHSVKATTSAGKNTKHSAQTKKMLVVVGIKDGELSMEKYDFEDGRWLQGPVMFKRPDRSGSVLLNTGEKIYMIGGWGDESRKVDEFDLKHGKWSECNDLLEDRPIAAAAFLDGDIYVSGGGGAVEVNSSEKLDQQTGRWVRIADMLKGRCNHGMCAMDGKIYAVGGYNSSMEYYNPSENSWTRVPDMSIRTSWTGVAGLDGKLYVVGGLNRNRNLKCVEVFNSVDQKWTRLADLNVARQSPGVVAANGLIYVAGGYNYEDNNLMSVEVYIPEINTWTMLTNRMRNGELMVRAAVIDWPY